MKGIIIAIIVVILLIVGYSALQDNNAQQQPPVAAGEGRVYFSVTDAAADMQTINEIEMQVSSVEVYSQAQGWITVSSRDQAYALLELNANGSVALYDAAAVTAGAYDQVRITLGDVVVDSQTEGEVEAVLPSKEITFDVNVVVEEGADSHVTLDFLADQSLHTTTEGEFVFAPVIDVESRSQTTVAIGDDGTVVVSGGSVDGSVVIGVDLNGEAKAGFMLDSSAGLEVDTSLIGETTFMLGGETYTEGEVSSESDDDDDDTSIDTSLEQRDDFMLEGEAEAEVEVNSGL